MSFPYPTAVAQPYDLPEQPGATTGQIGLLMQLRKRANGAGPDVIAEYGVTAGTDPGLATANTPLVQDALDENECVYISDNVMVDELVVGKDFGRLVVLPSGGLMGSGEATHLLTLEGEFSQAAGVIIPASGNLSGVRTEGFRALLDDVTITGESVNALHVAGVETQTFMGRYRGASGAGVLYDADDGVADLCMIGTYLQANGIGLDAQGSGAIDLLGVHSESNLFHGFRLVGASASRASHCYADSNGWDGWTIADTNYGITFLACWGFRSASLENNRHDWVFNNAHNIQMFGCESSGDPRNSGVKGSSFTFAGSTDAVLWGCKAGGLSGGAGSGSPAGVTDRIRFHDCGGLLLPYNTPTGGGRSYAGTTIASAGTADIEVAIDTLIPSLAQSVRSFLVTATWRGTDNSGKGTDLFLCTYDVGVSGGGAEVTNIGTPTGVNLSAVGMTDLTYCASLDFTATNVAGEQIQVGFDVRDLGSTRGFNF